MPVGLHGDLTTVCGPKIRADGKPDGSIVGGRWSVAIIGLLLFFSADAWSSDTTGQIEILHRNKLL